jgi:hypothetical protein
MEERNCAFQYAEMETGIFGNTKIVCDETNLTLDEAKELWDKYYPRAAKHIYHDGQVEMVIWVDMVTPSSYGNHLQYISTDAESDGVNIWVTTKDYFTKYKKPNEK